MELQTCQGNVSFYKHGFVVNCKVGDLKEIFKEIFKLVPKDTKVKDIKNTISQRRLVYGGN